MAPGLRALLIGAGLAVSPLAHAQTPATVDEVVVTGHPKALPETMAYRVGYADLNLTTEPGFKELQRRVRVAATYVCDQLNLGGGLSKCIGRSITAARPAMDKARLRQLSNPHGFQPGPGWIPPPGKS